MTMHRMLASASALLLAAVVGCGGQPADPAAGETAVQPAAAADTTAGADAVPATTPDATTDAPVSTTGESAAPRLVAPARGEAPLAHTRFAYKRDGNMLITSMRIQNRASAPIAGLKIDELWYDKAGNPVTGSQTFRLPRPLPPGETVDVELRVQVVPNMERSTVLFEHPNGTIKPTLVPEL